MAVDQDKNLQAQTDAASAFAVATPGTPGEAKRKKATKDASIAAQSTNIQSFGKKRDLNPYLQKIYDKSGGTTTSFTPEQIKKSGEASSFGVKEPLKQPEQQPEQQVEVTEYEPPEVVKEDTKLEDYIARVDKERAEASELALKEDEKKKLKEKWEEMQKNLKESQAGTGEVQEKKEIVAGDTINGLIAKGVWNSKEDFIAANPEFGPGGSRNIDQIQAGEFFNKTAPPVDSDVDTKTSGAGATGVDGEEIVDTSIPTPGESEEERRARMADVSNVREFTFRGEKTAIIDFVDDNSDVIYVYDGNNYRPFDSTQAVASYYGMDVNDVNMNVNVFGTDVRMNDQFNGEILADKYRVGDTGYAKENPPSWVPDLDIIKNAYGATKNPASEFIGATATKDVLNAMRNSGSISEGIYNEIMQDPTKFLEYSNAITYGGYTIPEVLRDIKARELSAAGNKEYDNIKGISSSMNASLWRNTPEGQIASADAALNAVTQIGNYNSDDSIFNKTINDMPENLFDILTETEDMKSKSFEEKVDSAISLFYDAAIEKSNAATEQASAVAESKWNDLQETLKKSLNIDLSQNARTAWKQLQELQQSFAGRGLANSGIFNEAQDILLRDTKISDNIMRDINEDQTKQSQFNFLSSSASSKDIKTFVNENPTLATQWGLKPSTEVASWFNIDNLTKKYPGTDVSELQAYVDTVLDENGNYRSGLYRTMFTNKQGFEESRLEAKEAGIFEEAYEEEGTKYRDLEFGDSSGFKSPRSAKPIVNF